MRTARLSLWPKTEIWLHVTAWAAGDAIFGDGPSFRAMAFHGASDTRGSEMRLARLEKKLLLERQPGGRRDRIYRLTARGRTVVLGGRDPEAWWSRNWDGNWRFVLFDLPADQSVERTNLLRLLRDCGFGCVQGSVWLSPHTLRDDEQPDGGTGFAQSLLMISGRPQGTMTDAQLVEAAWNWEDIGKSWRAHEKLLQNAPAKDSDRRLLKRWFTEEFQSWKHLMTIDPLLPEVLWPKGYRGRSVWHLRLATLPACARRLQESSAS
jgi:phenylacetic acid degradation operon negative regulatory protein